jgi:hypothetical protein
VAADRRSHTHAQQLQVLPPPRPIASDSPGYAGAAPADPSIDQVRDGKVVIDDPLE